MRDILMDVIEINLIMIPLVLLLYLFGGNIRRKYGAKCLRILWILLAIRWVIPVNFSFDVLNIEIPGFVVEDEANILKNDIMFDTGENHTDVNIGESANTGEPITIKPVNEVADYFNKFIHNPYQIILFVWLFGCFICFLVMIVDYLRFARSFFIHLQEVTDKSLLKDIQRLEEKYLGHSKIQIYRKKELLSPMLVGCIHPKLILPDKIADAEEMELIVKHELCHYKNRDLWFKLLVNAVWMLNWFNPCVYLLKKELMAVMEQTCDSYALQNVDEDVKEKYARLILSYADGSNQAHMFDTSFNNGKRNMKSRIDNMMEADHENKFTGFVLLSVLLILSAGLLVSCGEKKVRKDDLPTDIHGNEVESSTEDSNELEELQKQAEDTRKQMEEELQRMEGDQQREEELRKQMEEELQRVEEASTGTPTGIIEQPQVMYNNMIYYYYATGRDEELPDGYSLTGTIAEVDSENTPDDNFNAAGVDLYVGQEIYGNSNNPDIIYLKYDTGFGRFATDYERLE